ncbi:MAG: response regulator [Armatimonadetes bacterium]|nr:response regulator [Armatimonadota bacterium]
MPYKILVVDDEPPIVRLMEFILARHGHQMLTAVNGEQALEMVRTHSPDLILLDIMMPRIDGYEVARTLRADPKYAQTPIIMLSAKAQEEDIRRGMDVGVDAYITKPFSPEHLVQVVSEHMGRAEARETQGEAGHE